MNSFDQDDILLEIKRKKSASADVKPAGENAAPAAQTKTAAKSGSQDEEWDLLWQSVSTKQKKPQLFDYDAEEKRAAAAEIPVPEAPAAPAAVAVEEPAPEIPAKRKTNFEINIPDLDDERGPLGLRRPDQGVDHFIAVGIECGNRVVLFSCPRKKLGGCYKCHKNLQSVK